MTAKAKLSWLEKCGYGPMAMKRIKVCPHCGKVMSKSYLACPGCGMRLIGKTLYDRYRERHICYDKCGTVLTLDSRYCPKCGRPLFAKAVE